MVCATQVFEVFSRQMSTLSDPRDTTLVRFEFEQMCKCEHTDVRTRFAHRIDEGEAVSVLEMKSQSHPTMSWTEVCAADHRLPVMSVPGRRVDTSARLATRQLERPRHTQTRTVGPGRRVLARPAPVGQVRACRVQPQPAGQVVDDVPTWALLACGIVLGVLMLVALVLLGGPAYA